MTSFPPVRNPLRCVVKLGGGRQQLPADRGNSSERDHERGLYLDRAITSRAAIEPDARSIDQFGLADMRNEILLRAEQFSHFRRVGRQHTHRSSPSFSMVAP